MAGLSKAADHSGEDNDGAVKFSGNNLICSSNRTEQIDEMFEIFRESGEWYNI